MRPIRSRRTSAYCCLIASTCIAAVRGQAYSFTTCKKDLDDIINKNISVKGVNNDTLDEYRWHGRILGLDHDYSGHDIIAITYEGCLKICGRHTETRSTQSALEIAATWIFPLAIIFNLPYDSAHHKKFRTTFIAILNWIGSPQTALANTIFSVRQMRHCHRLAKTRGGLWNDAFYTLSCLGQFKVPKDSPEAQVFYETLVFGLFRPLSILHDQTDLDRQYTADLLAAVAFQLRMLRRRGVIPTLSSLGIFLVAFIFSIVLAFGDLEGNRTGSPLTLGLVYCWLPLLVIFTIIDRNPVSADRSATLMSRWLFNVRAVMTAVREIDGGDMREPEWWNNGNRGQDDFAIGKFIAQGRQVEYCGLVDAVIRARNESDLGAEIRDYENCATQTMRYMNGRRPGSWYVTAIAALLMVWVEVLMAFLIAIFTPTYGLGCWSASLLLYGILSSLTWVYHMMYKSPGPKGLMMCHTFNFLSFAWMIVLTGLALVGGFKNCYCATVQLSAPSVGGYMMFESFKFYMENFNMENPWIIASAVGGFVPGAVFIVGLSWWTKCQHLWTTEETGSGRDTELARFEVHSDTAWLAA